MDPVISCIKVLIVEDLAMARTVAKHSLIRKGYAVEAAGGVQEALEFLASQDFDVVITDYLMPEADGLQLMEEIQKLKQKPAVIMATAFGSTKLAVEFMKSGGSDFVEKPIDYDVLDLKVQQMVARQSLQKRVTRAEIAQQTYEQVAQTKQQLLQTLAETIQKPIDQILEEVVLIRDDAALPEEIKAPVGRIMDRGERLKAQLVDVILLSQLQLGVYHYRFQPTDFAALVTGFVDRWDRKNPCKITQAPMPKGLNVQMDVSMFENFLVRLCRTGICHGKQGPRFSLENHESNVLFKVVLPAMGVLESFCEDIFSRYVWHCQRRDEEYFNLTFPLGKQIVADHTGRIWVSTEENGDLQVYMVFPLAESIWTTDR